MLFSRQILNGSQDFFVFNIFIFIFFFKCETIETHARAFLTLNILAIGRVSIVLVFACLIVIYPVEQAGTSLEEGNIISSK